MIKVKTAAAKPPLEIKSEIFRKLDKKDTKQTAQADKVVVTAVLAATGIKPTADNVDPQLKPYQPNQSKNVPKT